MNFKQGDQVIVDSDEGLQRGRIVKMNEKTAKVKMEKDGIVLVQYDQLRKVRRINKKKRRKP